MLTKDLPTMGADDLVPVFTFCVVKSSLKHPLTTVSLLRELLSEAGDTLLKGEAAYYFLTFDLAVQHLLDIEV